MSMAFDSLSSYKHFVDVGMPEEQAEAVIQAILANNNAALRNLPTREEFKDAVHALRSEIQGVRTELKEDIAGLKADLIKWIVGSMLTMAAPALAVAAYLK